ncbi:MAG: hypothetical protein RBT64_14035 [Trichloromonas sp.]|nr:hypothetical protein [Trichloromonas sp.]
MPELTRYRRDMENFRRAARALREIGHDEGVCHWSLQLMAASAYCVLVWAGAQLPPGESRSYAEIARDADLYLVAPGHLPKLYGQWLHENVKMAETVEWHPLDVTPRDAEILFSRAETLYAVVDELLRREER